MRTREGGHRRPNHDIMIVERKRSSAALLLLSALSRPRSNQRRPWPRPALSAQKLPTVAGADARIVTTSDEGGIIERDDVEPATPVRGREGRAGAGRVMRLLYL